MKQEYFPYHENPQPSLAYELINDCSPGLIYKIKKDDTVNFDEASPLTERIIGLIEKNR